MLEKEEQQVEIERLTEKCEQLKKENMRQEKESYKNLKLREDVYAEKEKIFMQQIKKKDHQIE